MRATAHVNARALRPVFSAAICVLAAGAVAAQPAGAQVGGLGPEFQVSPSESAFAASPDIDTGPGGEFLIVWDRVTAGDPLNGSVRARWFDASGSPSGSDFQVNTTSTGFQRLARVGIDSSGQALVVWENQLNITGQRYAASGSPSGGEFVISAELANEWNPAVGVAASGAAIVAWMANASSGTDTSGRSIQARRLSSAGAPIGNPFQVNTVTPGNQRYPATSVGPDGSSVIVWSDSISVRGQRYSTSGAAAGSEFLVGGTYSDYARPSVRHTPSGGFVVAWAASGAAYASIDVQRYDASGNAVGSPVEASGAQFWQSRSDPDIDAHPLGGFVVVWDAVNFDDELYATRGQLFDESGSPVGGQIQVGTSMNGSHAPRVAFDGDGRYTVVWYRYEDPSVKVFGRRSSLVSLPSLGALGLVALASLSLVAGIRGLHPRRSGSGRCE